MKSLSVTDPRTADKIAQQIIDDFKDKGGHVDCGCTITYFTRWARFRMWLKNRKNRIIWRFTKR